MCTQQTFLQQIFSSSSTARMPNTLHWCMISFFLSQEFQRNSSIMCGCLHHFAQPRTMSRICRTILLSCAPSESHLTKAFSTPCSPLQHEVAGFCPRILAWSFRCLANFCVIFRRSSACIVAD